MLKKILILITAIASCTSVFANPAPLGIELNKTTLNEVKEKYSVISSTPNATDGYYNNSLDINNIDIKTLSEVKAISNSNEIIEVLLLTLDQSQFNEVYSSLASKYQLMTQNIPPIGDKYAEFEDGDCVIYINAPHMSFSMTVAYATKHFITQYTNRTEQDIQEEKEKNKKLF